MTATYIPSRRNFLAMASVPFLVSAASFANSLQQGPEPRYDVKFQFGNEESRDFYSRYSRIVGNAFDDSRKSLIPQGAAFEQHTRKEIL